MSFDASTAIIAALLVAVVALLAWGLWARLRAGVGSRRRNRHAQAGEADAERLLAQRGFRVVERQARREWCVRVDGEDWLVEARADLLVEQEGRLYVAEVKTGRLATDPLHPPTRRQLLEYDFVFAPDGLLLVDADAGEIVEVEFPEARKPTPG